MKFKSKEVPVGDILLDPFNPRFGEKSSFITQESLENDILKTKAAKELLNSMQQNIK